jgi:hypothetical protein
MRWYFNGNWWNCTEAASGFLGYLENVNNAPWVLSVGGRHWNTTYANAHMDDVRIFINEPMTRSHFGALYRGRGYNGGIGLTQIALRNGPTYVENPLGCSSTRGTYAYEARNGWGWDVAVTGYDRTTAYDPRLAGYNFTSVDGRYFRYDLPYGPGKYKVYAGTFDPNGVTKSGWAFKDGVGGTTLQTMSQSTGPISAITAVDINDVSHAPTDFFANQTGVELTFTSDHLAVTRDTSLNSGGNGAISWLAVEPVDTSSSFNPAWAQPATNSIVGIF